MSKLVICALALALAASLLAGCGSSKSSSTASTATTVAQPSVNAAIAAQVPEAIKKKGTLTVASEAQYAPNEFIAPDGHTVIGMDPDMVKALAAVMGLKANVVNSTFEAIIPGLAAGRYDIGASSFTDTKEREKTVDFVTYLSVGQAFLSKASGGPKLNTLSELCGHTVSVEKGTVELEEAEKQNKKCKSEGKSTISYPIGRGVLVKALTTMIGFGTLMISSERGLASLGFILTLGVGCCMLTALVFLPAVLRVLNTSVPTEAESIIELPMQRAAT